MVTKRLECCDNLDLLRSLSNDSVDLIYSDILYGTGRKLEKMKKDDPERELLKNELNNYERAAERMKSRMKS